MDLVQPQPLLAVGQHPTCSPWKRASRNWILFSYSVWEDHSSTSIQSESYHLNKTSAKMWLKKFQEKIIESMMEDMQRISDDHSLSFPLLKPSQHLGSQKNTHVFCYQKCSKSLLHHKMFCRKTRKNKKWKKWKKSQEKLTCLECMLYINQAVTLKLDFLSIKIQLPSPNFNQK